MSQHDDATRDDLGHAGTGIALPKPTEPMTPAEPQRASLTPTGSIAESGSVPVGGSHTQYPGGGGHLHGGSADTQLPIDSISDHVPQGPEPESQKGEALVGKILAGRYRIEKLLGSGGMGAVYRAEHVHMRKSLAIKVLHREMTYLSEVVARFEREAVAAANIEHPHVAAAKDFGRLDDGSCYLVLEFVDGRSLGDLLNELPRLPAGRAMHITRQVAEALTAAHGLGIVHRDLKPDNVMLIQKGADMDYVKVLDFGIAKVNMGAGDDGGSAQPLTQLGSVFGTPEYMAPEQAQGHEVDARADLYTLGVMLHEMLSGVSPFKRDEIIAMLTAHMTQPPPALPDDVPPAVAELTYALLRKSPDERPASATVLVQHIDALLADPNVAGAWSPPPPSAGPGSIADGRLSYTTGGTGYGLSPAQAQTTTGMAPPSSEGASPDGATAALDFLKRDIDVGGQRMPTWVLVAVGGGGAIVASIGLVLIVVLAMSGSSGEPKIVKKEPEPGGGAIGMLTGGGLLDKAKRGDRSALVQLEGKPPKERSGEEWEALGRGYAKLGKWEKSLGAYEKALDKDPKLKDSSAIARDVRKAMDIDANRAMDLAADHLGAFGVDALYDAYRTREQPMAARAWNRLKRPDVMMNATPAAKVAITLDTVPPGCNKIKRLLVSNMDTIDERTYRILKKKSRHLKSGGGFFRRGGSWGCLTQGDVYAKAMQASKKRPGPDFE